MAHFPRIRSTDLAGKEITLPSELPGERTVVLVAFAREQQSNIDGWVKGLGLDEGKLPWLELPVIDDPGAVGRWFIDGGMRRGIRDHTVWQHVVTLYTKKSVFNAALGITSEKEIQVFVVARNGAILQRVAGDYSNDKAAQLRSAF